MNTNERLIFLTDQIQGRAARSAVNLSNQIMLTVANFYGKPAKADGYRDKYGMTKIHQAGWDSGGFQLLMGKKLKGVPMEPLPCGIQVPVNASKTIALYKRVGLEKKDLPIQLDFPPRYDQPPEHRRQLIERSVLYYYEMLAEIPDVVPTIHGWTLEEIEHNLELITDPDKASKIALGSYIGSRNNWTMGNMNPHNGKVAAGSFTAPPKGRSAVDYVGPWKRKKAVGVGSYKATVNSTNPILFTDNIANPFRDQLRKNRIATAVPGALDLREGTAFVDMVNSRVATPVPGKVDIGTAFPSDQPQIAAPRKVAMGTFQATTTRGKKRAPYSVVINRIAMVMNRLRDDFEVFMLGGASPHMQHQVFLAGAQWTDTSAWRVKGMLGEIYLPEHSSGHNSFGIGYKQKARIDGRLRGPPRMDEEAVEILKDCLADPRHPYSGMHWKRFMEIGHLNMPQWRRKALKHNYEEVPFILRAKHNAFVLKCREEEIANEYINDPDRYYRYIKKRLSPRKILSNRLTSLWDRLKRPYVQEKLTVYLKQPH